jgi:aspartokinase/homoserine dehydrogenase 1
MTVDEFLAEVHTLDQEYAHLVSESQKAGRSLRYVANIDRATAKVGLKQVEKDAPLGILSDAENSVIFRTQFYDEMPIAISGPGAGPLVTAAGVLGDILDLSVHMKEHS